MSQIKSKNPQSHGISDYYNIISFLPTSNFQIKDVPKKY